MKTKTSTTLQVMAFAAVLAVIPLQVAGQGDFHNLDFEQATIVSFGGAPSFLVVASDALPGWTVYQGSSPVDYVFYDTVSVGTPIVSIHDSTSPIFQPLQGNYSVGIQHSTGGTPATAAIGQTAQLPSDAISLIFYAADFQNLQVTFFGNIIPLAQIGITPGYAILGGDISAYTGQTGELLFTHLGAPFLEVVRLDNIQFSDQPIPEPSTIGLFALGGLVFVLKRRGSIKIS